MTIELALAFALIIAQIAILIALFVFIIQHAGYAYSSGLDVPYVPTPKRYFPRIEEALDIRGGDVVYDLGCGSGSFVLWCAPRYPEARFVGIERNPFIFFQARFKLKRAGNPQNVEFRRENFFAANFSDATKIYGYLLSKINDELFPAGAHTGVRYASRAFKITGRTPLQTVELSATKGFHGEHLLHVYEL